MKAMSSPKLPISENDFEKFLNRCDPSLQSNPDLARDLTCGAEAFRQAHDEHALHQLETGSSHAYLMSEEQHPDSGAACDCENQVSDVITHTGIGECLVLSIPGNVWATPMGKCFIAPVNWLTLLKAKGIPQGISLTNSNNHMIDLIAQGKKTAENKTIAQAIARMAHQFLPITMQINQAAENNYESYREKGLTFTGTAHQKTKQALAIEFGKINHSVSQKHPSYAPVISVIDNDHTNERYVMVPTERTEKYIKIPDTRAAGSEKALRDFVGSLPDSKEWIAKWSKTHIGYDLATAYNDFLDKKETQQILQSWTASCSCTDSRTPPIPTIFGWDSNRRLYNYQVPGAFLTRADGQLTEIGAVYAGMVCYLNIKPLVHSFHTECGAKHVVRDYDHNPMTFQDMPAFNRLGKNFNSVYKNAIALGEDYYNQKGLVIIGDNEAKKSTMFSISRLMQDRTALIRCGFSPISLLQDTMRVRTSVINSKNNGVESFIEVPQRPSEILPLSTHSVSMPKQRAGFNHH